MIAAIHSTADAQTLIGWLIVLACILGAGYFAYLRNVVGTLLLLVVAIIAYALLL